MAGLNSAANASPCRLLFLGSSPAMMECYRHVRDRVPACEVVGVIPNTWGRGAPPNPEFDELAAADRFAIVDLDDIAGLGVDLGVSVQSDKILPLDILALSKRGFVNVHLAPLPEFRGVGGPTHAIQRAHEDGNWNFGLALHYMDPGLDTGPIIDQLDFPITRDDTAETLHDKTEALVIDLFARNIDKLVSSQERVPARPQPKAGRLYQRSDISHELDLNWPAEKIYDWVRSLTFTGKPRPYAVHGTHRIYLSLDEPGLVGGGAPVPKLE